MPKKLLIIGNANNGSVQKITESFKKNGWAVDAIEAKRFQLVIDKDPKKCLYMDYKPFSTMEYDAVIPRISGETFAYGLQVMRQLYIVGNSERIELNKNDTGSKFELVIENGDDGLHICSDKFLTHQYFFLRNIDTPITILTDDIVDYSFIGKTTKLPLIAKKRTSSQGKGVFKVKDIETANAFLSMVDRHLILQEFLDLRQENERSPSDIRAFTIGANSDYGYVPKVIAYSRYALRGDWKTNYSISKKGKPVELTEEQKKLAIDAAKSVHCNICGVDLAVTKEGKTLVIEANGNASLEGVTAITGINVADHIFDFINYEVNKRNIGFMHPKYPKGVHHSNADPLSNIFPTQKKSESIWDSPEIRAKYPILFDPNNPYNYLPKTDNDKY